MVFVADESEGDSEIRYSYSSVYLWRIAILIMRHKRRVAVDDYLFVWVYS